MDVVTLVLVRIDPKELGFPSIQMCNEQLISEETDSQILFDLTQ